MKQRTVALLLAAALALWHSPAPRRRETTALRPMPKPMATALIRFWTGKTRDRAVMASSPMRAM